MDFITLLFSVTYLSLSAAHDNHLVHVLDLPLPLGALGHFLNDALHVGAHDNHSVHVLDLPFPLGTLGHVFNDHLHVGAHDNHPVHVRP